MVEEVIWVRILRRTSSSEAGGREARVGSVGSWGYSLGVKVDVECEEVGSLELWDVVILAVCDEN